MLADALAEEATARVVSDLGMGYTVWHDVAAPVRGGTGDDKLDHIVLSPSGLYAVLSEDFGGPVGVRRGELTGDGVTGTPVADLLARMRIIARAAGVRFGGAIIVLPDDDLVQAVTDLGKVRGMPVVLVARGALSERAAAGRPGRAVDRRQRDLRHPHPSAAGRPVRLNRARCTPARPRSTPATPTRRRARCPPGRRSGSVIPP